jgi:hypothetical protein
MAVSDLFRRPTRFLILAFIIACRFPQPAHADSAPRWTDAQLVGFSDVIVRGRVTRVAVASDERVRALYTYVTLDVSDVVKGRVGDRQIILKQLGGRSGSTALDIAGQPTFAVGEDVVVFLEVRPRDRTLSTTALWQGKFTISSDGSIATRQDPGAAGRGIFGGQSRALIAWLPALRRESSTLSGLQAEAIEFAPQESDAAIADDGWSGVARVSWRDISLEHQAIRVDTLAPGQKQLAGGGEQEIRRAAEFWTATGMTTLSTGGLQPSGCFTTRDPDGRISIGVDSCGELNPRGGTLAVSGGWVRFGTDRGGAPVSTFLGAGVITNGGDFPSRFLARSVCFERLVEHELGHALGLIDSPDGGGVMAPSLECDAAADVSGVRPMFVPLTPGVSRSESAGSGDVADRVACVAGCGHVQADSVTSPGATNLAYTLNGSTLTLTWTAPPGGCCDVQSYLIRAGSMPDQADVANVFIFGSGAPFAPPPTSFSAAVGGNAVFYVRVVAFIRFSGQTAPSNEIAIVIGNATPPPPPPSGLTASVAGTTVTLGWSAPGSGQPVTSYIIQAGSQPGSSELANFSTGNSATMFSASGVAFGTYFVRVRTVNGASISIPSNEVQVDVTNTCVPPGPPSNLAASVAGSTVTLTWSAGTGASSYQLQAGSSPGGVNLADRDLLSPATSFTAPNVSAGTYFVRVRSNNACGQSGPSNEVVIIIR